MGFRDIKQFNVAMLGKQGWRLMTDPESLCARVIKGEYYPNGDFLSATKKWNSSNTWSAILLGKKALQGGLMRRIGNGESTNIWHDRWIPGLIDGRLICPKTGASTVHVSELLFADGRSWNDETLESNLLHMDAQAVRRIPLGRRQENF
jgi:hypothetical protein